MPGAAGWLGGKLDQSAAMLRSVAEDWLPSRKLDAKLHELDTRNNDEKGDEAQLLPPLRNGETAQLHDPKIEDKETRPPPRYNEGTDRGDAKCLALC